MALRLRRKGIERVRPLAEGLEGWRRRGFEMTPPGASKDLKDLLEAAPLEGLDLTRRKDPTRDVDL